MEETLEKLLQITDGCRDDMHEPDEQGLSADVHGYRLDNAFPPDTPTREIRVKLIRAHGTGEFVRLDTGYFNLATLIALARKAQLDTAEKNRDLLEALQGFMLCRTAQGAKCVPNDSDFEKGAEAIRKAEENKG